MKHIKTRELVSKQLIRFSIYQLNFWGLNPSLIAELIFLAIHPNLALQGIYMSLK